MNKPQQTKLTYGAEVDERLEALEEALFDIQCAMESVQGFGEFSDLFDSLNDLYDDWMADREELSREEAAAHEAEQDAMTREYWRDVL